MSRFRPSPTTLAVRHAMAGAALLAMTGAASAQSAPVIERIEVSAQRRIEPLQEVPAAVTALTERQLEMRGVGNTQDFVAAIPNMSFDQSFTHLNSFVVLRGVTQINNADSPVAIVVDGVPQNNQKQFRMNLFDIQRIEVLKGPQGALYGRNALGGAINIVTKAPSARLEGFGGVNLADGSDKTFNAGLSGPLGSDGGGAAFRLVAQHRESGGLIRNDYLERKVDGIDRDTLVRGKLSFAPGKDVTIDVQAGWNDFKAGANHDSIPPGGDVTQVVNPVTSLYGKTFGSIGDASVKLDVNTGIGTLTAITAYTDLEESYRGDLDFSNPRDLPGGFLGLGFQAGQGQDLRVRMTSQELRLTSPENRGVRWIGGVYALRTERRMTTRAFIDATGSLDQIDNGIVIVNQPEKNRNTATAVFGQVDVDLTPQTTLSAALRHDRDERRQTDLSNGAQRDISFSKTQPKLTLTHRFSKDALVYATASTGFRSGGLNAPDLPDFRAETLANYEVGSKNTLLGGAMVLNLALFEGRSKDFQYFYVDVARAAQLIGNIDRVRMRGLDFDLRWRVSRDVEFDAGLGITDSIIKANHALPDTVGRHTPKNTPLKATLGSQVEWALGGGRLSARADIEHRSKRYWEADNANVQPAIDLLNLRLAYAGAGNRWSVALWGKNVTDEAYYTDVNSPAYSGLPYTIAWRAQPRTVGIDAKFRF
ncbi:TonB-dependent receptor [Pseudorhodoferax sp.]|uniref:TonB-dependent receptor n=1 Tax=Pseudorhodoferax sp. TaxID=1993553 RepID=UPI002DD63ED4|nr:TonB-dependent receptor [Pseudorhodoferax sp.]